MGRAYYELGELTDAIGSKPAALDVHRKALAVRRELADGPEADAATKADVARSLVAVGQLQASTGDTSGGASVVRGGVGAGGGLGATVGAADPLRAVLALVYDHIGWLLRAGRPAEALAACERAKSILEELADANPNTTRFQSDLARSHNTIGVLLQQTGRPAEALAAFERAMAILWKLTEANPNVTEFQEDLAFVHEYIGHVLRYTSKPYEALASYRHAAGNRRFAQVHRTNLQ